MSTYTSTVRVAGPGGGTMVGWATVTARDPHAAMAMLQAQYGRSNVIGVPRLVR